MGKVLVVDDDAANRQLVRLVLALDGHDVVEAEDGRYALSLLQDGDRFDLLVLDLMMPWVDGWEVLRSLEFSPPPVIVVTGRDDDYAEARTEQTYPIARYLTKPYDPEDLAEAVRDILS